MIEITDIYRSIRELLESNFMDIPVQLKDFKVPKPPCFYIKYISGTGKQTAEEYKEDNISIDIIYFAKNEKLLDLLKIQKELNVLFHKPLKIKLSDKSDSIIQYQEIEDITMNLNEEDYVLNCTITLNIEQRLDLKNRYDEYDNEDLMDELEYII